MQAGDTKAELEPFKAKARELKAQGVPLREIAKVMGMPVGRINYYIYGKDSPLKVGSAAVAAARVEAGQTSKSAALLPQFLELRKQGYTYVEIAKKLDITNGRASYLGQVVKKSQGLPPASTNGHGELPSDLERHVSFAAGHISAWLEVYADSLNVSRRSLSEGVMGVLKARR